MSNVVPSHLRSKQLSAFIDACLEPLPEKVLADTAYNSLVRQARRKEWKRAEYAVEFYNAYLNLISVVEYPLNEGTKYRHQPAALPTQDTIAKCYREAKAALLRTPVYQKTGIDWKRRQDTTWLPITQEEVDAAIAADEAFIAAHPTKRKGGAS